MAKGILGRKLGMTQIFDPETGAVTSVTVIAAGPCPVVQVKTNELDGYEAVQLAFDAVPERKLTKPELGHLKRFGVGAHRRLVGASATPSRVFKGVKLPGRMGGRRVTQVGLQVHDVDAENNLLLVKGSVPGPKDGLVEVRG